MLGQPDEMTQTMIKIRSPSCFGNQISCSRIQIPKRYTRPDFADGRLIGCPCRLINLPVLLTDRFEIEGTGHVGAVAILDTAHIEQDTVSRFDSSIIRVMMRICRIRAESN